MEIALVRKTITTLVEVTVSEDAGERPTFRLLFEGQSGPVDWPAREIREQSLVIGRSATAKGLQLDDPRVSRRHIRLWSQAGGREIFFEDSSTNGTFVNGRRLRRGLLEDGDIVRIGDSFLQIRVLSEELDDAPEVTSLVGRAPSIVALRRDISRVAPTVATALITGESGTGKELVARELHVLSRRSGPFVAVNCSAIPAGLAESQLFGHVAGSFTGAKEHIGLFRSAAGGTLFLDEIGELPTVVQPKLLRVLEDRQVTPVGSVTPIPVDVRIVVATNRDLEEALDEGTFRGDLFARLAEITIRPTPLRERQEDILPLFKVGWGGEHPKIMADLVEALLLHPWPYNVRELFKVAKELAIVGGDRDHLDLSMVKHRFSRYRRSWDGVPEDNPPRSDGDDSTEPIIITKRYEVSEAKKLIPSREEMESLLRQYEGNISEVARRLDRSRRQIHRYLKMYNLNIQQFRG